MTKFNMTLVTLIFSIRLLSGTANAEGFRYECNKNISGDLFTAEIQVLNTETINRTANVIVKRSNASGTRTIGKQTFLGVEFLDNGYKIYWPQADTSSGSKDDFKAIAVQYKNGYSVTLKGPALTKESFWTFGKVRFQDCKASPISE